MTVQLTRKQLAAALREYIGRDIGVDLSGRPAMVYIHDDGNITVEIESDKTPKIPGLDE